MAISATHTAPAAMIAGTSIEAATDDSIVASSGPRCKIVAHRRPLAVCGCDECTQVRCASGVTATVADSDDDGRSVRGTGHAHVSKIVHQGTCLTKTCLAQPDWNPRWSLPVAWGWRQWHSPKTQCSSLKPRQLQICLAGVATQTQCRLPPLWCLVRQGRGAWVCGCQSVTTPSPHGAATHGCFTLVLNQLRGRYDAAVHRSHRVNCSS